MGAAAVLTLSAVIGALAGTVASKFDDAPFRGDTGAGQEEGAGVMPSRGLVRSWDIESMQGVIDGDDVPGFGARAWTVHPDGSIEEEHFTDEPAQPIPTVPRITGHTTGTVRMWNDEEGWGVIDSDQTPCGCWAHYSNIIGEGFRTVPVGATVMLDWEQVTDQDGYQYRATRLEQQPG